MKWQALRQEFCIAFSPNHFPCWAKHHRIVCSLFGLPDIIWALKPPSHTNLVDHIFDKTPSLGPQRAQRCGPAKEGRNRVGVDSLRLGMGEPFAWERSGSTLNWERGKWDKIDSKRCEPRGWRLASPSGSPPRPSTLTASGAEARGAQPGSVAQVLLAPPGPRATAREARPGRRGSSLDVHKENGLHASLPWTRKAPHKQRVGRHHPFCYYFFIRDSPRQGGGDVCGQQSAKKGEEGKEAADTRRDAETARKVERGHWGSAGRPEGAAEGRGVTKADRPALTAPGLDSQPQLRLVDGTRGWPLESPCLRHVPWGSPPPPPPSGSGRRGKSSWELHAASILGHPSFRGLWKRPRAGSASPDPISSPSVPRRATQSPGAEVSLIWVPPSPQPPSSRHPAVTRAGTEPWTDPREFPTARWLSLRSPRNKVASPLPRAYSTPLPSSPRLPSLREPACKGLRVAGREREEGTKRSSQRARPSLGSALPESSSLGCALRKASGGCPRHKSLCLGVPPV